MTKELAGCIHNICKNFNFPDVLRINEPLIPRGCSDIFITFLDTTTSFTIEKTELIRNGIKTPKDYRKLRRMIRARLINATYSLKHLAEDMLENLGESK